MLIIRIIKTGVIFAVFQLVKTVLVSMPYRYKLFKEGMIALPASLSCFG